jgi:sec-independent protein translocase protein TatA
MPPMPGPWELILILLIVVVIFGAGRLSEIGGALGKGIREFRSATKEEKEEAATKDQPSSPASSGSSTQVSPANAENKCPSCGTVNPSSQAFCGQCGTRLARAA